MPARTERICIFAGQSGQPGLIVRFPLWWDRRGFFEKFHDREVDTGNPLYVDYGLLLTPAEALAFDQQCWERCQADAGGRGADLSPEMESLRAALKNARWVVIESSEWESGLD